MFFLSSGPRKQKLLATSHFIPQSFRGSCYHDVLAIRETFSTLWDTDKCISKSFLNAQKYPKPVSLSDFAFFKNIKTTFFPFTLLFVISYSLAFLWLFTLLSILLLILLKQTIFFLNTKIIRTLVPEPSKLLKLQNNFLCVYKILFSLIFRQF